MNKKNENTNPCIEKLFEYDDYRRFLADYFNEQKRQKSFFSHRYFAQKAGFSSPSLFIEIVKGTANLTFRSLPKMVKGLGLRGHAAEFFEYLVYFNQAADIQSRETYYQKLIRMRKRLNLHELTDKHSEYVRNWYYPVIRELIVHAQWNGDYKKLASLVRPAISESDARMSVECLVKAGLVVKTIDGKYIQESLGLTTLNVSSHVKQIVRKDILNLGTEASMQLGPDERYCAYTTLSLSKENYDIIISMLDNVRRHSIELAIEEKSPEKVYQLLLQVFPFSQSLKQD